MLKRLFHGLKMIKYQLLVFLFFLTPFRGAFRQLNFGTQGFSDFFQSRVSNYVVLAAGAVVLCLRNALKELRVEISFARTGIESRLASRANHIGAADVSVAFHLVGLIALRGERESQVASGNNSSGPRTFKGQEDNSWKTQIFVLTSQCILGGHILYSGYQFKHRKNPPQSPGTPK